MNHEFLEETDNTEVSGNQLVAKYKCEFCISCSYKCFLFNFTYISVWKKLFAILKEISPGISLEGMMLKLKLQYFGHFTQRVDSLEKTDAGRDWGQEEKGTTEDEMAGWHH